MWYTDQPVNCESPIDEMAHYEQSDLQQSCLQTDIIFISAESS